MSTAVLDDLKISVECMRRADVPGPYEWHVPLVYAQQLREELAVAGVEVAAPAAGDEMDIKVGDTLVKMQVW